VLVTRSAGGARPGTALLWPQSEELVPGLITGPGQSGYRIHASLASLNEGLPLELCGELVEEVVQVAHLHAGVTFKDDAAALERRLLGANR
jgi:hypothetical protein